MRETEGLKDRRAVGEEDDEVRKCDSSSSREKEPNLVTDGKG